MGLLLPAVISRPQTQLQCAIRRLREAQSSVDGLAVFRCSQFQSVQLQTAGLFDESLHDRRADPVAAELRQPVDVEEYPHATPGQLEVAWLFSHKQPAHGHGGVGYLGQPDVKCVGGKTGQPGGA